MPNRKISKNGKVQKRKGKALINYGPSFHAQQRAVRVLLPWSWTTSLAEAAAGGGAFYSFAVNSAFDPNFTGVGAQPLGFDQYSALYGRYRVLGVRYRVLAGSRTAAPIRVGVYPSAQSTLPADVPAWPIQNQWAKVKMLGTNTGSNNVADIGSRINISAVMGVTQNEFITEHDFSALTSASPARLCYLHFWITCNTGVIAAVDFSMMFWMEVEFIQPVALSLS
jgi:hypothetical protein